MILVGNMYVVTKSRPITLTCPVLDEACMTIVNFLEIGHTQAPSSGWQLFMAIDTLAAGSHSIIDCMSAALLPSTLVKCLYLFFDLPPVEVGEGGGDVTPAESRLLLQKTFVQVGGSDNGLF